MKLTALAIAVTALLGALASDSASADTVAQKSRTQASKSYRKGLRFTRQGDRLRKRGRKARARLKYTRAIKYFLAAYRLAENPVPVFALGKVYRLRGDGYWALLCFRKYLERAPRGAHARKARWYVRKLAKQTPDLEGTDDSMDIDPVGVCYSTEPRAPAEDTSGTEDASEQEAPQAPAPVTGETVTGETPGTRKSGKGWRVGFYTSASVTVASGALAALAFIRMNAVQTELDGAIAAYEMDTGDLLAMNGACADAEQRVASASGVTLTHLQGITALCARGASYATASNWLQGVAVVGVVVTGFMLYKGFVHKPAGRQPRAVVEPILSRETVGAQLQLHF